MNYALGITCALIILCGCTNNRKAETMPEKPSVPDLYYDVYIRATPEQVWQAIVDPAQVARYYPCPLREFGQVGGPAIYGNYKTVFIDGKVIDREEEKLLVHSFRFPESKHESVVIYMLELLPDSDITQLVVKHTQFGEDESTYHDVAGTWGYILSGMKSMLETGKSLNE